MDDSSKNEIRISEFPIAQVILKAEGLKDLTPRRVEYRGVPRATTNTSASASAITKTTTPTTTTTTDAYGHVRAWAWT
jgi:hypothetical protein